LAQIILIIYYPKYYLAQQCNIVMWRWRHIWRHQKCR